MRGIYRIFIIPFAVGLLATCCDTAAFADPGEIDEKAVVEGNNAFALDLYAKLKEEEGNIFFSPYSISSALAMTYAGARGRTAKQMAEVLHFDSGQERLRLAFGALIARLNAQAKDGGYQLSVANALWGQKGYRFLKEFLDLTRSSYGAGLRKVDFRTRAAREAARKTINTWVEKQTEGKIKNLIKPEILNRLTRLVLTNAIYFKGNWARQFEKGYTKDSLFWIAPDKKLEVPMMYQSRELKYTEGDTFQALELPYVDNELSMVVLLPKKIDGLAELEGLLTASNLKEWFGNLRQQEVRVYLPRFRMTSEFRLDEVLQSMGMTDAFSLPPADLSGMTGGMDLFISAMLHKAFVEVNEKGTEAAAATAEVVAEAEAPTLPPVFRANHPFIFLIRDTQSGAILFLGRVVNPSE